MADAKTGPGDVPCNGCTLCCRNFHAVVLFPEFGDVVDSYETIPLGDRRALAFKDNGECIYLGDSGCTIHGRAPGVCRHFDCRGLFATSTRQERRAMIKAGEGRDIYKAGRDRVATLDQSHPDIVDLKERARKGESYLSRTGALKTLTKGASR